MPNGPLSFEDLLEAAPDAMVGVDAVGSVVFANARARALLDREPVGAPLGDPPPGYELIRTPMGAAHELILLRAVEPTIAQLRAARTIEQRACVRLCRISCQGAANLLEIRQRSHHIAQSERKKDVGPDLGFARCDGPILRDFH